MDEEVNIFVEIDFGTSREEFRVQSESKEYILSNGELKHRFRTPIVHKLSKDKPQKIKFHPSFEYRGSYFDLEKEKLKLSVWRYHNFRLNTLDAMYDIKLHSCANSDLQHNCFLLRINQEHKLEKVYKMDFNLYFQEIYDFQLSLDHWEVKGLMSHQEILNKLSSIGRKVIEVNPINNSTIIDLKINNKNNKKVSIISQKDFGQLDLKKNEFISETFQKEYLGNLLQRKRVNNHCDFFEKKMFEDVEFKYSDSILENNKNLNLKNETINTSIDIIKSGFENHSVGSDVSLKDQIKNKNENIDNEKKSLFGAILKLLRVNKKKEDKEIQKLDSLLLEAQLDQAKLHPADCNPKLKIKLVWPNPLKEYVIFSKIQKGTNWPIWDNIGSIYLRGTIADLENSFLDIEVIDSSKERINNSQAKTHIPLKSLIESSTVIESKLSEPFWLTEKTHNLEERRNLATWDFGLITGNISFKNYPIQRQKGNFVQFVKDRLYLMVKITKVDNIITLENFEDPQIYVSITHQGLTARSTTAIEDTSKNNLLNDYIIFPLQLPPISELYSFHLESLGEIYIDLWVKSKNSQKTEHAGYTSFTIWDTIYTIKGIKRPVSERYYTCYTSGSMEKLKVRILEQEVQLKFLFPTDRVANISYEAFITPDLLSMKPIKDQYSCSKNTSIAEKIDIFLRSRLELLPSQAPKAYQSEKTTVQTTLTSKLGTKILGRFFLFSTFNHRGNELMITQFVNPIPTPDNIKTPNAIFHFVRCIPFINTNYRDPPRRNKDKFNAEISKGEVLKKNNQEDSDLFTLKKNFYWFSPDFTLLNNGGGVVDHCLLHVSLLLKLKIQAFVCIGSTGGGNFHAWVMSWHHNEIENNTLIKFWELTTGQIYVIKNRFISTQRAREVALRFRKRERLLATEKDLESNFNNINLKTVKLPYKSIDTIFNEMNIWYNIQDNNNPGCIFFDLWNKSLFISCTYSPLIHQPGFRSQPFLSTPNKVSTQNMKSLIKSVLNYEIQARRTAQNLGTKWNRDPMLEIFLEKGLELIESSELSNEEEHVLIMSKFNDWKVAMESKVPSMHRVLGFPLSFNHTNPRLISDTILGKLEILFTRNKSATLSMAVVVNGYPNNTFCSRVFILVIQKISERERKKILEKRERERIRKEEKSKKKLNSKTDFLNQEAHAKELKDERMKELKNETFSLSKVKNDDAVQEKIDDTLEENNNFLDFPLVTGDFIGILDKENKMIRKRRVVLPEGSISGRLWISKKIKDDGNFRYYIENIERAVSEGLKIPKNRVCATELNYEGQRIGFAILPSSCNDDISPLDLMYEMALKVEEILKTDEKFIAFTGGDAVLEWDYDQEEYEDQELVDNFEDEELEEIEEIEDTDNIDDIEEENATEENATEENATEDEVTETDEHTDEVYSENDSNDESLNSKSNSDSSVQQETQTQVLKHILRRQSSEEILSEKYSSDKSEVNEKEEKQDIEENKNNLNLFNNQRPIKVVESSNELRRKEQKRFTKTGKYIIYKRPESERSKLKKKELSESINKDDLSVYPATTLAISLARGHFELREKGLLNGGRKEINTSNLLRNRNLEKEVVNENKKYTNSNSSDLISNIFHKGELNVFPSQLPVSKYRRSNDDIFGILNGNYISRGSSITIRKN